MENNNNTDTQENLPKGKKSIFSMIFNFFSKRFKIFRRKWVDGIEVKLVVFHCGIVPMAIVYFFFKGTRFNFITEMYEIPLKIIYTIFTFVFLQTTELHIDRAEDILPIFFTIITMGLIVYTLVQLFKLCLVLFADGVELLWKRKDVIEESFYNGIK